MAKVICTRPNAGHEINGVKFTAHPDGIGMVSEEISNEQAEHFTSIPGYELVGGAKKAHEHKQADAGANAPKTTGARKAKVTEKEPADKGAQAPAGGSTETTPATGDAAATDSAPAGGSADESAAAETTGGAPDAPEVF